MNCPACNKILKDVKCQEQTVGLCEGCGGIWLEHDKFYKTIEKLVSNEKVSYSQIRQIYKVRRFLSKRRKQIVRKCPRCNIDMGTFNFSYNSETFLDKCPFCKGIWTDKKDRVDLTKHLEGASEANPYTQVLIEAKKQFLKRQVLKRKNVAIGVAAVYLVIAFGFGDKGTGLRLFKFLIVPLAGIFLGQKIDDLIKFSFNVPLGIKNIKITLGEAVVICGWVLLFLPLFFAILFYRR
ncbi:MAG: zf-TFIIB domain-containing protein [Candidatus Omnitrophica bacterium]|nr:zf-TFIIB domain-containing protein [Candidatus Omnitrophota bacterium]